MRVEGRKGWKHIPNGISMISAMVSMPMKVNATTVTMGTVPQPSSFTKVNGRENK